MNETIVLYHCVNSTIIKCAAVGTPFNMACPVPVKPVVVTKIIREKAARKPHRRRPKGLFDWLFKR